MDVMLDEQEADVTFKILRNRMKELRNEVRHEKNSEAREYLKHQEHVLRQILEKFPKWDENARRL